MHRPSFNQQHITSQSRKVIQSPSLHKPQVTNQISASGSANTSTVSSNSAPLTTAQQQQHQQTITLALPSGWKKEESLKPTGLTAGKTEVYYVSPQGRKVKSKQEMQVILGEKYDLSLFDWRSGKFMHPSQRPKRPGSQLDSASGAKSSKLELIPGPVRRTGPIFPTEVKVLHSHPTSKRSDVEHGSQEPPRQLFWEKRLAGGRACDPETGEAFKPITLPKSLINAGVPGYEADQLFQSLISSLVNKTVPIIGQQQSRAAIEKNPCIAVNFAQPFIKQYVVTDEDIRQQEARVKELRRKLALAKKKLQPRASSEREG